MSKFIDQFKALSKHGIGGILLAGVLLVLILALIMALSVGCLALGWAVGAGVLYYAAGLLGYAITYKVAYGAAMLLSVLSGVIGGIKINNLKS